MSPSLESANDQRQDPEQDLPLREIIAAAVARLRAVTVQDGRELDVAISIDPALPARIPDLSAPVGRLLDCLLNHVVTHVPTGVIQLVISQPLANVMNICAHVATTSAISAAGDRSAELAPCRHMAEELRGSVGVAVLAAGTTVWASLPLSTEGEVVATAWEEEMIPAWRCDAWPDVDPAILDLRRLLSPFGGVAADARPLLRNFLLGLPARFAAINDALAREDLPAAIRSSQRLKIRAKALGATRLGLLAANLQDMLEEGHVEIARMLLPLLDPMLAELMASVGDWMKMDENASPALDDEPVLFNNDEPEATA